MSREFNPAPRLARISSGLQRTQCAKHALPRALAGAPGTPSWPPRGIAPGVDSASRGVRAHFYPSSRALERDDPRPHAEAAISSLSSSMKRSITSLRRAAIARAVAVCIPSRSFNSFL